MKVKQGATTFLKVIAKVSGEDPVGPLSLSLMGILATSVITAIVGALQKLLKNLIGTKPK